ncbi:DUF4349 domain-containing protein [Phycicoccus sp.]|uniref:DUF4349 domain-containing protein n=1 Tax=Phycicoccus sp. TaxID=1902410 RepID=UPI002BEAA39A|nr:DUF4349 domain-containing protein [Phycicoccus sp.]HMM95186.1 DUF4349 domain-containing protein [Phycicoccus sp.]
MSASTRPPSRRLAAALAAGALAVSALGACSGGSSGDSAAGGAAAVSPGSAGAEDSTAVPAPDKAADAATSANGTRRATGTDTTSVAAAVAQRKLARRADVALEVKDVPKAASALRGIATGAGGLVVAEEVSSSPGPARDTRGAAWGTLTISVPTAKLDATLDEVARVGTVLSRQSSTDDVTAQYVDTSARVETMRASVERVRALMGKADKLADVVNLEAELSRRQADLEALEQQLAALDDQVSLSPVTVRLSTPGAETAPAEDPTGFVAGLTAGWDAFTRSVQLVLTLLGALLPFGVAAAVVVLPLLAWWRRRRAGVTPVAAPTPPAAPSA